MRFLISYFSFVRLAFSIRSSFLRTATSKLTMTWRRSAPRWFEAHFSRLVLNMDYPKGWWPICIFFFLSAPWRGHHPAVCRLTGRDLDFLKPQHLHITVIPITFNSTCLLTPLSFSCLLHSTVFFPSCLKPSRSLWHRFTADVTSLIGTCKWTDSIA